MLKLTGAAAADDPFPLTVAEAEANAPAAAAAAALLLPSIDCSSAITSEICIIFAQPHLSFLLY